MKVRWSARALDDREAMVAFIAPESFKAALELDDRIATRVEDLREMPESGRPGRLAGTRELVITGTPYIAIYAVLPGAVRIIRIIHGARSWPPPKR